MSELYIPSTHLKVYNGIGTWSETLWTQMLYKASAWEEDKKKKSDCAVAYSAAMQHFHLQELWCFSTSIRTWCLSQLSGVLMILKWLYHHCAQFAFILSQEVNFCWRNPIRAAKFYMISFTSVSSVLTSLLWMGWLLLSLTFSCVDNLQNLKGTQNIQMSSSFWQLRDYDSRNLTVQQWVASSAVCE